MLVANERRYQLQSEEANRQIEALLESLRVPAESRPYYAQMLTSVLKLFEDEADLGDVKMANSALKDLRYAVKVFDAYRGTPKVTVFGSARVSPEDPIFLQARRFARMMVEGGWMVITGAGGGVMQACQEGAGRERSFGLNIRLPFEQEANAWIADDPKLINFKYFFLRKLFFLKEASALCLFPGGFGTSDETFEALTLIQTGKTPIIPVVLLDVPGGDYWRTWERLIREQMVARGFIAPSDPELFSITDQAAEAVDTIFGFYRNFHSSRWVGDDLVLRVRQPLPADTLSAWETEYADILKGPVDQLKGPLTAEGDEWPELWRLVIPFGQTQHGRLRELIDALNRA